ncbi:Putative beta-lactamase-inhibitor-like, PepSY-like [Nitrosomonas sp. Nm33]|nr:Putative beta-lactamase-inhibitor-like, PepSY-like [Nitrosomonas sp. Nm33]
MQLWIVAALATFLAAFGQANAGEKELSKHQVPKAVLEAFEKAYPNTKKVEFEKGVFEGKDAYEVEYKEDGREHEILYSPEGVVLQKEETIDVKTLPEPVVQAISKAHPKATIKEAEKIMKPDGTITGYEVELKTEGKELELELELDLNGNILKTERD